MKKKDQIQRQRAASPFQNQVDTTDPVVQALEDDARDRRRGLWAGRDPVAPWEFRAGR